MGHLKIIQGIQVCHGREPRPSVCPSVQLQVLGLFAPGSLPLRCTCAADALPPHVTEFHSRPVVLKLRPTGRWGALEIVHRADRTASLARGRLSWVFFGSHWPAKLLRLTLRRGKWP